MKDYVKENIIYIIILLLFVGLTYIRLPYYVNAPGGIIDISSRIEYDNKKNNSGSINMLYVTEYVATIPSYLLSFVLPDWDLESIKDNQVVSNETVEEINIRNKVLLNNSVNNAMYVAYKAANKKIVVSDVHNMVIVSTLDNGLKIGDELLYFNGKKINNVDEIKEAINALAIGDELLFRVIRNKREIEVKSKISDIDGKKALGVVMITNYDYDIDPKIKLSFKPSESGSSGGLMMALCIYNAISGEDILKGKNIAGTGTIDINGNVGEIGGIKYKIIGAYKNHMDVVLVPSANYKEALATVRKHHYNMKLVKIDTFEDAIKYLKSN